MKYVKAFAIILVTLAIIFGALWQFWLKGQVEFASVATAYTAKMICSCRFVAEREMESCLGDFTVDTSQISYTETENNITASVLGGLIKSDAAYEPGLGCTLLEP